MKIYVFEARNDELEYIEQLRKKYNIEIETSKNVLDLDKINELENSSLISTLGLSFLGENEFKLLAKKNIHYLSTRTIGYNHFDINAAKKYNIHICNANYAPDGVADYTIMMILLCLRAYKQTLWRMQVNDFSLEGLMGKEIRSLTIGIMGTGRIGCQVARDLSGFGCKILGYNTFPNPEFEKYGKYVNIDTFYKNCDLITLHMPLTEDNYHIINKDTIAKMKHGIILINCARGSLMNLQDLITGVETKHIGALGLDTIENEETIVHKNLKTDIFSNRDIAYIKQFKNVIYTQHMAFYTQEAVQSMVNFGIEGLISMYNNVSCENQIC